MTYDWTQFNIHIYCNKPVDEVFRMWATPEGLEKFFIKSAKHFNPDLTAKKPSEIAKTKDVYHWTWIHEYELSGEILEVTDKPSISFTFGNMAFKINVIDAGEKSLVKLHQYNIPDKTEENKAFDHLNCRSCWVFYLTNLKSVLEKGYDLRDANPDHSDSIAIHFSHPK
jgi:uncharacterized protein YndB with AHSA1/START domain